PGGAVTRLPRTHRSRHPYGAGPGAVRGAPRARTAAAMGRARFGDRRSLGRRTGRTGRVHRTGGGGYEQTAAPIGRGDSDTVQRHDDPTAHRADHHTARRPAGRTLTVRRVGGTATRLVQPV